jgi:ABC-type nickel/cobalt efflux system permease component RcnA
MIDIQLMNDVLATLAFAVGLVIVIVAGALVAAFVHERQQRKTHIGAIEQHLADVAPRRTPAHTR